MSVPSDPATIEMVDVALRAYSFAPASEPKLTNPDEVQEAIRGLKLGKAPGPDGIPNRSLKHLPLRAISLLVTIFNAVLTIQYFPAEWKHARVFYILQQENNPVSVMRNPSFSIVSLLRSPEMQSTQEWLNRRGDVDCASCKSPPLVRPLVGWLVGWYCGPVHR